MTYQEIIPNLFLGDQQDAIDFDSQHPDGQIIVVLEQRPVNEPFKSIHVPILTSSGHVHSKQLNRLANIIDLILAEGEQLMVHCGAGIERSPLTIMWYLHRKLGSSYEEAYNMIKTKRPQIADRSTWLVID